MSQTPGCFPSPGQPNSHTSAATAHSSRHFLGSANVKDGENTQTKEKAIYLLSRALFRPSFLAAANLEEPFSSLRFLRACTDLAGTKHGGCWCRCLCCATGGCLLLALSSAGQELGALLGPCCLPRGHLPAGGTLLPSASSPSGLSASACIAGTCGAAVLQDTGVIVPR